MAYEENLNGKIQIQSEIVPDGGANFQPVVKSRYVKGAPQKFTDIQDLIDFHPNLMDRGMVITIIESPVNQPIKATDYQLIADPATLLDPVTLLSKVNETNFLNFWIVKDEQISNFDRVFEYAPAGTNGGRPPFPYEDNPDFEQYWEVALDRSKGHEYFRFRDDDIDDNADGIFDNWSVPISIGTPIKQGDYIANSYTRQNVNPTVASNQGELLTTNLGIGDTGWFQVLTGSITEDDGTTTTTYSIGKYFKYNNAYTYTFNNSGTCVQTLPPPKTAYQGSSNDDGLYTVESGLSSIIYSDGIPAGTADLWEIVGQKSVYGGLKSDWSIKRIDEDASLTRYAISFSALPSTVCSTTQDAENEPYNTDLENIGWFGSYQEDASYIATRTDLGGGTFSEWAVKKIKGENGEYKDRAFKLFPINTDFDLESPPSGADAIAAGWSDTPLSETPTSINGVIECTKFYDGTLKSPWSTPVPYTGQDAFNDYLISDEGLYFKYQPNSTNPSTPTPEEIIITANLDRGINKLYLTETISYEWVRIYNNGAIDSTILDGDTNKTMYYMAASGNYLNGQRITVTPDAVDGKSVFQCTQTLTLSDATTIIFVDEIVIYDVTDGKDARALDMKADVQVLFYNTTDLEFSVDEVKISAFENNLPTGALYWYEETAPSTWTAITSGVGGYTYSAENYGGQLQIDTSVVFTADGTLESKRYAVSNVNGNPDTADNITTFVDYITITKSDSSATAQAGADAVFGLLTNEAEVLVLDADTGDPIAGEIGASGIVRTLINLYDGNTKVQGSLTPASTKYSVTSLVATNGVTPAQQLSGTDVEIYISDWPTNVASSKVTATIDYDTNDARGVITRTKVFSITTSKDAAGALLLTIDSSDGRYSFNAQNLTDIDLTANLYNDKQNPALQDPSNYYYSWKVGSGAWGTVTAGGGGTLGEQLTISRSDIRLAGQVQVRIFSVASPTIPNDIIRTASVDINDVQDGKTYRLYQADTEPYSKPAKPSTTVDPSVGDGSWLPTVTDPVWAIDGTQKHSSTWSNANTPEYEWGDVYQIGGETGDQGKQGGGYYYLYSSYDNNGAAPTFPNGNTSTIDQMLAGTGQNAWQASIPATDVVWRSGRLYKGYTATAESVKLDASLKLVGSDDSAAEPVDGSVWETPVLLSDATKQGIYQEIRYQGKASGSYTGFTNNNRSAGTGWSTTKPSSIDFNIIYETRAYIDPIDNSLDGTWSVPTVISDRYAAGNDTEVQYNSGGIRSASPNFKFNGDTILLPNIQNGIDLTKLVAYDTVDGSFKIIDITTMTGNQKYCTLIRSNQSEFSVEGFDNIVPTWTSVNKSDTGFTENLSTGVITSSLKGKVIMSLNGNFGFDEVSAPDSGDLTIDFYIDNQVVYSEVVTKQTPPPTRLNVKSFFEFNINTPDNYVLDGNSHTYQIKLSFPAWNEILAKSLEDVQNYPVDFSVYFENAIA